MIVDSSAIAAIVFGAPERSAFLAALVGDDHPRMSAASFLEVAIVVDHSREFPNREHFDQLLSELAIRIEPVTEAHARLAREAYQRYGRGSGSLARLNFGDCFTYALAKVTGEPLLFKGNDFRHTDILPAVSS